MKNMTKKRIILFALVISWMILIFWFSSAGYEASSGQSMRAVHGIAQATGVVLPEALVRKAAHVLLYFVLGVLLVCLVRTYKLRWFRAIACSTGAAFVYAITDELHQLLVGGRSGQASDVLLDTIAAFAGAWAVFGCCKWAKKLLKNQKYDTIER